MYFYENDDYEQYRRIYFHSKCDNIHVFDYMWCHAQKTW